MSKYLVIVESPTKARTIFALLGKDYEIISSMGHIVDLPSKRLSVDVDEGFKPHYRVIPGKEKILTQLKKKAKNKEIIYLATDPDREGEAISWHIKAKLPQDSKTFYRVIFHEITREALRDAFANPGTLNTNKVNAQIARRVLDRIVGYLLSPLLWRKVVRGLSAGRVQSVALKFIVEREKEIQRFIPKTTYRIEAQFKAGQDVFTAKLERYREDKAVFETKDEAEKCIEEIKSAAFCVKEVTKKQTLRRPLPPHTTSLLQQDGFNKFRFSSQKTMLIAQRLYEGADIKDTRVGLITYMRTDSFSVAPKAKKEVKGFIKKTFGQEYLPEKEYRFKEKKGAQAAHEAIRPTSVQREPTNIKDFLATDEAKLYELIWRRFVASFMREALFENTKVILSSQSAEFIAEGKRMVFEGYLKVLGRTEEEKVLPLLAKGDEPILLDCQVVEQTTKPPPRFNDASLVRLLEEKGIGRPSTYAPTISTLFIRNYARREKSVFFPTELGIKVSDLLVEHFPEVMNEDFTALMEERLDAVEEGNLEWQKILEEFYPSFKKQIDKAKEVIQKEVQFVDKTCPQCNNPLVIKWSRKGRFLSCSNFPQCRYAESITTDIQCPDCKEGKLIERRNKRGQFFYGCTRFPQCHYTSRTLPNNDTKEETQR
ncbi:MAG: type I DNA topoisomerase [Candidatus Omnitrophota bacterium]|nr:MAG: type I DNA topoisomerase [Candidatus Omnitrophota bacterium]